jgi:hypothetical protein
VAGQRQVVFLSGEAGIGKTSVLDVFLARAAADPELHARTQLPAAYARLTFDTWRMQDWEICASASETIQRLSDAGPPAFDRMIYAHLQCCGATTREPSREPVGSQCVSPGGRESATTRDVSADEP